MVLKPVIELSTKVPLDFYKIPRIFPQFTLLAITLGMIDEDGIDTSRTSGQQLKSLVTQVLYFDRKGAPYIQFLTKEGWKSYWLVTDLDSRLGWLVDSDNRRKETVYYQSVSEAHPANDFCHWASVRFGHWCDFPFIDFSGMQSHVSALEEKGIQACYPARRITDILKGYADSFMGASSAKFIMK